MSEKAITWRDLNKPRPVAPAAPAPPPVAPARPEPGAPHEPPSPDEPGVHLAPAAPEAPGTPRTGVPVHGEPGPQREPASRSAPGARREPGAYRAPGARGEGGYTKWENRIWDDIAPTLEPYDAVVFAHLYRLTAGFDRAECMISIPRLAFRCNVSENRLRKSLAALVQRGLVERVSEDTKAKSNEDRGVVWRVPMASPPARREPGARREPPSSREPGARGAGMKETMKENVETAAPDIYEIRKTAARIHEAEPELPHDELVAAVRRAYTAEGRGVTREEIEEAIRGLAM